MKSRVRVILSGTLASLVLAIAGCPGGGGEVPTNAKIKVPTDAPSAAASGVQTSPSGLAGGVGASTAPTRSATPSATVEPTPTPSPTPSPTPYVENASTLTFLDATASVAVRPAGGAPLFSTTHQIIFDYKLTSGNASDSLTWTSSNQAVATVGSAGLVTSGTSTGSTVITATSILNRTDGKPATASITLTVTAQAALNVIVK